MVALGHSPQLSEIFLRTSLGRWVPRRCGRPESESRTMSQTKFTVAALVVGFTISALIVLSAIGLGAVGST
jgi:hypothetical protein